MISNLVQVLLLLIAWYLYCTLSTPVLEYTVHYTHSKTTYDIIYVGKRQGTAGTALPTPTPKLHSRRYRHHKFLLSFHVPLRS